MPAVTFLSGTSGLSFDSTLLSTLLFFCGVLLLFLSYVFAVCWPILLIFSLQILYGSCLAARSWLVVCAAYCHMTLIFAVMHLYSFNFF